MDKKYNVLELYVVKIKEYYFICEKLDNNIYREIFTEEKFQILNNENVESLGDYYRMLVIKSYLTNEELMLSKLDLLVKYAELNAVSIVKDREKKSLEDFLQFQKEYLETLKELKEKNPEIAKKIAVDTLHNVGILDGNGELIEPYNGFIKTLKKD